MKKVIPNPANLLTSILFLCFFCWSNLASAQNNPCVKSDQCFDFEYSYVANNNNSVTINFDVTVNCNHDLSNVAFELPSGVTASSFTGNGQVENPTNNPFYSIKWDTNAGGKNGAIRSFSYTISASAFASMTTIRAHAKASTTVGQVTFNAQGCGSNPPAGCTLAANISGPALVCPSSTQTYTYTTAAQAGASYNWTVPNGFNIQSGQNSNTLVVKASTNAAPGQVAVAVTKNDCTSASDTYAVAIDTNCGTTPPTGPCVKTDECFEFSYLGPVFNNNGTVTLNFTIKVDCNHDISYAAFGLPAGVTASASSPSSNVENPTNNPFYAIKFENLSGKNGTVKSFSYTIDATAFANMTAIQVQAKAALTVGTVTFDPQGCGTNPPCPITAAITGPETICLFSDDPFIYSVTDVPGATYNWTITNATITAGQGTNTVEVMANVFPGPGSISVLITTNCGSKTVDMPFTVIEDCDLINPLPVELLSFKGVSTAEGVALNWVTASEKDNDRFEVQRSADGRSFETVGTVKGNGNSNTKLAYTFLDKRPVAGSNYYRLRQVDFDGTSEFTKVILVDARKKVENPVTLYPNPSTDGVFNVRMQSADQNVTLQVMDISGRVLHTRNVSSSNDVTIDGNALGMKPGIYLISVKAGEAVSIQKLMIK